MLDQKHTDNFIEVLVVIVQALDFSGNEILRTMMQKVKLKDGFVVISLREDNESRKWHKILKRKVFFGIFSTYLGRPILSISIVVILISD